MSLKVIYLIVFIGFAVDVYLNSSSTNLLIAGIGLGAIARDLFVSFFGD